MDEVPMAWKGDSSATFSGASGQMAVMGELLHRKCNAAIPHVDVGTDVFAFRDDREEIARIQVKAAPRHRYKRRKGYKARFAIPISQLRRTDAPPLFYALAVRLDNGWGRFIIISRTKLQELWDGGCGSENKTSGDLELNISFRPDGDDKKAGGGAEYEPQLQAVCGDYNLRDYIDAWESLPPLKPPVPIDGEAGGVVAEADVEVTDAKPPQA
jgi:hypothetical protein